MAVTSSSHSSRYIRAAATASKRDTPIVVDVNSGPRQMNKSLVDAIGVFQTVVLTGREVGASDVGRQLGMEVTKAHRLLRTLAALGMLYRTSTRRFVAGPATHVLAGRAMFDGDLPRAASAALAGLREKTKLEVAMGLLWQREVSYLYHVDEHTPVERALGNVKLYPASRSSLGLVLLGRMEDAEVRKVFAGAEVPGYESAGVEGLIADVRTAREKGYARVVRSTQGARVTMAVLIPSRPFMAIGVGGPDVPASQTKSIVDLLHATAAEIDAGLAQPPI